MGVQEISHTISDFYETHMVDHDREMLMKQMRADVKRELKSVIDDILDERVLEFKGRHAMQGSCFDLRKRSEMVEDPEV